MERTIHGIKLKAPRDIIFGVARIRTPLAAILLDCPMMQRCRFIYQLQASHFVYPSATHTRFEHQLSVYHCTNMWLDELFKRQPELRQDCDERHAELIAIAALYHDQGQLSFCHNFSHYVGPALGFTMHHEALSVQVVQWVAKEYLPKKAKEHNLPELQLTDAEVEFVCSVILGEPLPQFKPWLFQIVASYRNEIDTDRLVYLVRDSEAIKYNQTLQIDTILRCSRVIDGDICFSDKITDQIHQVFYLRYLLHKHIYQHHAVRAVDLVIRDFMICLGKSLRWRQKIEQGPTGFQEITDALVYGLATASNSSDVCLYLSDATEEEKLWMDRARRIAKNRLLPRRFYKLVNGNKRKRQDDDNIDQSSNKSIKTSNLTTIQEEETKVQLDQQDEQMQNKYVERVKSILGFTYNDENPMDRIYYYNESQPDVRFLINAEDRSRMISSAFAETKISYYQPPEGDRDIDDALIELRNNQIHGQVHPQVQPTETVQHVSESDSPVVPQRLSTKRRYTKYSNGTKRLKLHQPSHSTSCALDASDQLEHVPFQMSLRNRC